MKRPANPCPMVHAVCDIAGAATSPEAMTEAELLAELHAVQAREAVLRAEILRRNAFSHHGPRPRVSERIAVLLGSRTVRAKALLIEMIVARVVSTPAAGYVALTRATRAGVLERVPGGYRVAASRAAA